ncbi:FGGY-family carbohydrate kinase [Streptomyces sp. NPDC050560]|uniref:FGGY-family carbohydrate kinase n=1 Tax=Streptomyces sp. NPDC050560 TaxID=3365630 RepID=UPI00379640CA
MIISHDLGTTGDKASLHDNGGRPLAACTVGYPTRFGHGGVAEQDPEDWWRAACEATRRLVARAGVDPGGVDGIALSGQMMGAVFLDGGFAPVRPAMIWADHRSTAQSDLLAGRLGMESAYRELGHRVDPTYSLAKVMWVRDNEPENWARVRHVCLAKDLVTLRLTGRLVTDPSDASSTNAYDQNAGAWSRRVLDAAELPEELLPPVVASTEVAGGLTAGAAAELGLAEGTPVVVGGGDGPMAAVGAGVVSPADGPYVCMGSSSWISVAARRPLLDPPMRSMTFNHVVPGHFVPTTTMQAGGACLAWVVDLLSPGGGPGRFGPLLAAADEAPAADEGLYFLPHLLGERSPYWNPAAAGVFAGLGRHHGRGHMVRAVLEGVAFNLRTCIGAFRDGGVAVERVDVIGGGAGSDVWLRVLADVWGVEVRRRSIVEDANSLGAAVTGLVGLGLADGFGIARGLSTTTAVFTPDARRCARYAEQHGIFLDAYERMRPWFDLRGGEAE